MDAQTLSEVMGGNSGVDYAALLPGYLNAARAAGIHNQRRAAMWAAQLGHESVGLQYMEEIASGAAYNGRSDLGNIHPGDGPRFKGRGPIQLTGRSNYRAFSRWAMRRGHSGIDFEAEPHRLSEPRWGFLAATYYWTVSRPDLNKAADAGDVLWASRLINGWVTTPNGMPDRTRRYQKAMSMGTRIIPGKAAPVTEKVLEYSRDQVSQDTSYNCGPASAQTIVRAATGTLHTEVNLGRELGTHTGGTDYIGSFPAVLNRHIPGGQYRHHNIPAYPGAADKDIIWGHITRSIDAGHGVVVNIVAPPSNYPRAVSPSTISPAYSGGTVYHYIAAMGYRDDGQRKVWIADSGFSPYGYWIGFDQLCTLIVPKGYAYSTAAPQEDGEITVSQADRIIKELKDYIDVRITGPIGSDVKDIRQQLTGGRNAGEYPGWEQLGQNDKGQNLTLVDGVAAARHDIANLKEKKNG